MLHGINIYGRNLYNYKIHFGVIPIKNINTMIPEKVYFQQGYPVDAFHNQHWGMLGTVEIGETDKEAWDKMRLRCEEMWKRYMIENNPKFYYGVLGQSGTISRTFTDEDLPVMNKDGEYVKQ